MPISPTQASSRRTSGTLRPLHAMATCCRPGSSANCSARISPWPAAKLAKRSAAMLMVAAPLAVRRLIVLLEEAHAEVAALIAPHGMHVVPVVLHVVVLEHEI